MSKTTIAANQMSDAARVALAGCTSVRNMHDVSKKLIQDKQLGLDFDPKRHNAFDMPIALLRCDMKESIRNGLNPEQVRGFADTYKTGGYVEPIAVVAENGTLRVVGGFHRYEGLMLALSEGATLKQVGVIQVTSGRRAEITHQLLSNTHEVLDPLERANGYRMLLDEGMSVQEIATEMRRNVSHVNYYLELSATEPKVQEMIASGEVKPTTAMKVARQCRKEGTDTAEVLKKQLAVAHSNGSATITPKSTNQASALYSRKDLENTLPALLALAEQLEQSLPLMGEIPSEVTVQVTLNGELAELVRSLAAIRAAYVSANQGVSTRVMVG
ncbi:ParB/RepB/Spo0J family partition protein [Pseudomonas sp. NPDC089569]|uniref:ParB/RepB/Spo0J family partition protein n=1 Tax=Pseudomonas sp. NPDC089569 TaxID=3390722 RepID=UPI003CFE0372